MKRETRDRLRPFLQFLAVFTIFVVVWLTIFIYAGGKAFDHMMQDYLKKIEIQE